MKLILVVVTSLYVAASFATEIKYPVSEIPEQLKDGMYAVVRESDQTFTIESKSSSVYSIKKVITILKPEGKDLAEISVSYDKLTRVESFKAVIYDAFGNVVRKLKSNDIKDVSAVSGGTLFDDNRLKYADLRQAEYPYTIEYEWTVSCKFLYDSPDFYLVTDDEVSAQSITYSVIYPEGLKPRYKLIKIMEPQVVKQDDKREALIWKFTNVKPDKFESLHPDNSSPAILVSPNDFIYAGYPGNMSTWQAFGQWQASLNNGRDILPETTIQKVNQLTQDRKTTEEKAKVLYEYLQSKTRYVSIQLGIGGLQPFEAKIVDQTGYGDCKGLSNYMVALLKVAGVKSYHATIMAGPNARTVLSDFPSQQANHMIVAVPNGRDTLWLECTNQTNPFGYIGRFTCDRKAMIVTETGGKLVNTPKYNADQNTQIRSGNVVLQSNGDATAKVSTVSAGLQYDDILVDGQKDDQKKWLQRRMDIPNFDISNFNIVNNKDRSPSAVVEMNLSLRRYASISGKRLFFTPNLMNKSKFIPEKVEKRKSDVFIRSAYLDIDTIQFTLPEGVYPEFMPPAVKLKSRFGEYEASFLLNQDKLIYVRRVRINKGQFPADTYNELVDFYKGLTKADNTKMVFLSKT